MQYTWGSKGWTPSLERVLQPLSQVLQPVRRENASPTGIVSMGRRGRGSSLGKAPLSCFVVHQQAGCPVLTRETILSRHTIL